MARALNGLFLVLFLVLLFSFVSADQIVAKIDSDTKVVFRILDADDEMLEVPLVSNYDGVSMGEITGEYSEFYLKVYLLDKESGDAIKNWLKGPFESGKDIVLEISDGTLVVVEDAVEEATTETSVAKEQAPLEETTEELVQTATVDETPLKETVIEETTEAPEETSGITGNVAGSDSKLFSKSIIYGIILVGILLFLGFMLMQRRKKVPIGTIPEEKELLQLEHEIKEKRELIGLLKEQQKLKNKIESKMRRAAMTVSHEDQVLSKFTK